MYDYRHLAERLLAYRIKRRLSLQEMADEITANLPEMPGKRIILSLRTYQRWERGETQPQPLYRIAIEKVLNKILVRSC